MSNPKHDDVWTIKVHNYVCPFRGRMESDPSSTNNEIYVGCLKAKKLNFNYQKCTYKMCPIKEGV